MRASGKIALFALAMASASHNAPALAETDAAEDAATTPPDEIVVTATRRSETIQNVPISIQAVTGTDLGKQGAVNFADYARTLAGISFQDDGPGRTQIFMRGVSTGGDIDTGKESTVGIYFDETPVSEGSSQPDLKLFDISRVEVLRGPQGTLYGSGSLGGTVRVITNQPDFSASASAAEATLSTTRYGGINVAGNGWVNLPLGPDTAVRLVGYGLHDSGFLDNGLSGEKNINDETSFGGRLALRHRFSPSVDMVLSGIYQHSESGVYNQVTDHYPTLIKDQTAPEPSTDRFGVGNLKITADLGLGELTSSTSYFDRTRQFENDIDYFVEAVTGIPRSRSMYDYGSRSFTQELRLASKAKGPFEWLVGGFYLNRKETFFQTINDATWPPIALPQDNLFYATTDSKVEQIAGFAEVSVTPLTNLKFTAGLRVSSTSRNAYAVKTGLFFGGVIDEQTGKVTETSTTPKFNLSYQATNEVLLFAQAAKGFRIGGVNPGLPPCAACVVQLGSQFGSDSLWNYEIGIKTRPLGNALTLNLSVFQIDWKDVQLSVGREDGFTGFINAGRARSRGFELEVKVRPSASLELGGQLTHTIATLRTLGPGLDAYATPGEQLPQVPRWSSSGFAEWSIPVSTKSRFFVRGDIQYVGSRTNVLGPNALPLKSYTLGNLRTGFDFDSFSIAAFVQNVGDTRAQLNRDLLFGVRDGNPVTLDRFAVNTPQTFGVTLGARF